ncbi:hypothetical protein PULV_b0680 [Pseudoalteromonas ulvae UL12]|nr:hypothetical protein [Pseudoalteromonas ulvae UL12]
MFFTLQITTAGRVIIERSADCIAFAITQKAYNQTNAP